MSKKNQIGYSLVVWETLKEYDEKTKFYEPTKNKRVEVSQVLSEELSDNEEVKSLLIDKLFGYKDDIKQLLKNGEYHNIPSHHKELLEKDQKIADLEAKLAELNKEPLNCSQIENGMSLCIIQKSKISELEARLAESETEIKEWIAVRDDKNKVIDKQTEKINQLKKQLAEKEKEIALLEEQDGIYHNQLAIEQLEKLKEKALHFLVQNTEKLSGFYVDVDEIDQQIKELKEKQDV